MKWASRVATAAVVRYADLQTTPHQSQNAPTEHQAAIKTWGSPHRVRTMLPGLAPLPPNAKTKQTPKQAAVLRMKVDMSKLLDAEARRLKCNRLKKRGRSDREAVSRPSRGIMASRHLHLHSTQALTNRAHPRRLPPGK